jgi:hypothetical protein
MIWAGTSDTHPYTRYDPDLLNVLATMDAEGVVYDAFILEDGTHGGVSGGPTTYQGMTLMESSIQWMHKYFGDPLSS